MDFFKETRILIRVLPPVYVEIIKFYDINYHSPRGPKSLSEGTPWSDDAGSNFDRN